jgi:hypothetical protein
MSTVGLHIEPRHIGDGIVLETIRADEPSGELLTRLQVMIAGLLAQTLGPKIAQDVFKVRGINDSHIRPTGFVQDPADLR